MKKGLFLVRGECFRIGSQASRKIEYDESKNLQKKICENHISLIDHVKDKFNVNLDLIVFTQSTEYNPILEKLYQCSYLKKIIYLDKYESCQMDSLKKLYESIKEDFIKYDFIFLVRCDTVFKEKFFSLLNPFEERVMFPFICWYKQRKTKLGNPRPSDVFFFIPKKYFAVLDIVNNIPCSETLHEFLDYALPIISDLEYGVYINTYHDSDPNKDFNPLYFLPARGEINHSESDSTLKFPENF